MIKASTKSDFKGIIERLESMENYDVLPLLHSHGKRGVTALSRATPVDKGEAAASWSYKIEGDPKRYRLVWTNSVMAGRAPLVIILQYGHATKDGYFLSGRDFINPAMRPVFNSLRDVLGAEVLE